MKLTYLPTNQAWAFTFGYATVRLYDDNGSWPLLFTDRGTAKYAADLCGLHVQADGSVHKREKVFEGVSL